VSNALLVGSVNWTASSRQIQHIYDNTVREYPAVGVLTASNRDVWAKASWAMTTAANS